MANDQTEPAPAGISTDDMPLKERWYKYREKVLRSGKMQSHEGDIAYWEIKNAVAMNLIFGPPVNIPRPASPDDAN